MQDKLLFVSLLLAALSASDRRATLSAAVSDRYIVILRDDTGNVPAVVNEHARDFGVIVERVYGHALRGYAGVVPAGRLADIEADPRVAFVSQDRPVWAVGQTLPTGVDRVDAEQRSGFASNGGVGVAVIDTGSGPHPDLNVVGGVNCSTGTSFRDGNGHGTHVAGTIGAINNNAGVVGVAPGVPIYSVRVLNDAGNGTFANVICGIDWVTANAASTGIKVANMSLGGAGSDGGDCSTTTEALQKAICNSMAAGVTYVVAAGNSASDFASFVPAAYDQVLTVTAMADFNGQPGGGADATCLSDVDDTAADFSNFTTANSADASHTIAAPGVCIFSTWRGGYKTISGTSMAAPHVTGSVAACLTPGAPCAGMTPDQVMAKLLADAAGQPLSYGFAGDPNHPLMSNSTTLYYGYLVRAASY